MRLVSVCAFKLEFHGTDTDTDTDIIAESARGLCEDVGVSGTPATSPFSLLRAGHTRRSWLTCSPTCPTRELFLARILERMSVRDALVYTRKRVLLLLYTISYRVHVYKTEKHLKNVGPIRHCDPPHAALPFTRCRYCRTPLAHRCPQQHRQRRRRRQQRQRVTEGTAMAP